MDQLSQRRTMKENSLFLEGLQHITPGALLGIVTLLLGGIGAWYDLSSKVALQTQRIDMFVTSVGQREDRASDAISQHVSLPGHPVEVERLTEITRRSDLMEARITELERARDRLRRAALISQVRALKLQVISLSEDQEQTKGTIQEVVDHPSLERRVMRLFGR